MNIRVTTACAADGGTDVDGGGRTSTTEARTSTMTTVPYFRSEVRDAEELPSGISDEMDSRRAGELPPVGSLSLPFFRSAGLA